MRSDAQVPEQMAFQLESVLKLLSTSSRPALLRWWSQIDTPPKTPPSEVYPWIRYATSSRFNIMAVGAVWRAESATFEGLSVAYDEVRQQVHDLNAPHHLPKDLPLAFGGGAFDCARESLEAPWSRWPVAMLFIPEILYIQMDAQWYRIRHLHVHGERSIDDVVDAIRSRPHRRNRKHRGQGPSDRA